jgi:hypothetical protein
MANKACDALIFSSQRPGNVYVSTLTDCGPSLPGIIKIENGWKANANGSLQSSVIITRIDVGQHVNIQFMPTLADMVYAYAFGDRMGEVTVQGIAFNRICNKGGASQSGIDEIMDFYENKRAIQDNRTVTITVGRRALRGFLTDMRLSTANTELKTTSFILKFATLPRPTRSK